MILIAVVVLAAVGLGVFIATFDADRYRPLVVSELQRAIGRPVRLERISLGWRHGIAMQLHGFAIDDAPAGSEPLIEMESASALVRLWPLLRKEVQVASVALQRPRVHVTRDAQGHVNLLGLATAAGPVAASHQAAAAGSSPVSFHVDSLTIENGTLHWTDAMSSPPVDLRISAVDVTLKHIAPGKPMDIDLKGTLAAAAPNLRLSGRLTPPSSTQPGALERVKLMVESLPLEDVLPSGRPEEPHLRGKLAMALQGSLASLDPAQITRSLSGNGNLKLAEPVVANLNILREVFARLSMFPELVQTLEARLPPEYQAKFSARDTILSPIDASVTVEDGALRFDELHLGTDTFQLVGGGRLGLDGVVSIRSTLRIEPILSAAIIKSVSELQALTTKDAELEIPLMIQGQAPSIAILPDLHYVASKVIVTKAVDLLGQFLEKNTNDSEKRAGAGDSGQDAGEELLGRLLKRAIQRNAPSQPATQ